MGWRTPRVVKSENELHRLRTTASSKARRRADLLGVSEGALSLENVDIALVAPLSWELRDPHRTAPRSKFPRVSSFARRRIRLTAKSSSVLLSLLMLAACSNDSGPIEQGPTSEPGFPICVDVGDVEQSTVAGYPASSSVGFPALVNTGGQTAVIDSVVLVEPTDLSIIESWIVTYPDWPEGQSAANFGILDGYIIAIDPEWWLSTMRAEQASGAAIRPADETNDAFVLVLGLQIEEGADLATADGVTVEYSVEESHHVYLIDRSIELALDGDYPGDGHCG